MSEHMDELMELVSAALDGRLDDAGKLRLEEMLQGSEELRRIYVRLMTDSAGVAMAAKDRTRMVGVQRPADTTVARGMPAGQIRRVRWMAAAAAVIVVAGVAGIVLWNRGEDMPRVAVVSRVMNAEWEGNAPAGMGSPLAAGWWNLRRGTVDVRFNSGATVSFQGPSEFELRSAMEAYCRSGRLMASVPPEAKGFCMVSPMWRVVDLGTEFGMVAGKQNEVHVFRGQVQVERAGAAALTLAEGEALGTGVDGQLKAMRADRRDFDDLPGKRLHGTGGMTRISMTEFVLQTVVPDDEGRKAALRPRVEQFIAAKRAWLGDPMMPDEGVAKAQPELWAALMARDTPEDQLQQKLEALRIAKKSALVTVQEAEGALRGELTAREEAILVLAGWMN